MLVLLTRAGRRSGQRSDAAACSPGVGPIAKPITGEGVEVFCKSSVLAGGAEIICDALRQRWFDGVHAKRY